MLPGTLELETLIRGVFERKRFLDLLQHFIVLEEGRTRACCTNHHGLRKLRMLDAVRERTAAIRGALCAYSRAGEGRASPSANFPHPRSAAGSAGRSYSR